MEDVETYRSLFAEVLVLGSTIQGLKGDDQAKFERRISTQVPVQTETVAPATVDVELMEKPKARGGIVEDSQREKSSGQTVDGLKGLSRIMYRQHAKKLKRAYSVA